MDFMEESFFGIWTPGVVFWDFEFRIGLPALATENWGHGKTGSAIQTDDFFKVTLTCYSPRLAVGTLGGSVQEWEQKKCKEQVIVCGRYTIMWCFR